MLYHRRHVLFNEHSECQCLTHGGRCKMYHTIEVDAGPTSEGMDSHLAPLRVNCAGNVCVCGLACCWGFREIVARFRAAVSHLV